MDGNGRWARRRGLPVAAGHRAGTRALRRTVEAAIDLGVESLTVYAFSTENWSRPPDEVDALMEIFARDDRARAARPRRAGRAHALHRPPRPGAGGAAARGWPALEEETARNDRLNLWIAFDYGGRARDRRGGAAARRGRRRAGRGRRGPLRRAPLRARAARPGPADPHVGRAADLELPALAARLRGARVRRQALAGLRRGRAAGRARGVRGPPSPLRRPVVTAFWSRGVAVALVGLPLVLGARLARRLVAVRARRASRPCSRCTSSGR